MRCLHKKLLTKVYNIYIIKDSNVAKDELWIGHRREV